MVSTFYPYIIILQGIVNAIRELGGRFLVLDEHTGIYSDIGNKKAMEKTSQALREGKAQVLKDMIRQEEKVSGCKSSLRLRSILREREEMPSEVYLGHSIEVLKSLYYAEKSISMIQEMAQIPAPNSVATQLEMQTAASMSLAHMAPVLDQFGMGMVPVQQQHQPQKQALETRTHPSNTPPPAPKMPPRPSLRSTSPDLRESDTLSLSTWSLSSSLSLSDTSPSPMERHSAGTCSDRELFRIEEGMEMELNEPEPDLMRIQVTNIDDLNLMR